MSDHNFTVAASAQRSTSAAGSTLINRNGKGVILVVKTTAGSGTSPTVTVKLQGYVNGIWIDLPNATTAAISNMASETVLALYPGVGDTYDLTPGDWINFPLTRIWRVYWTIGGSDTPKVTFSIEATIIQ